MDEAHFEQAQRLADMARDVAQQAAQRAAQGAGQADCEDCGEPIAPARRVAFPAAVRCFYCQTEHERGRRLFGNPAG